LCVFHSADHPLNLFARNWLKGWDAERAKEAPADKGGDDGEKKPARKPKTVPRAALVSGPPGIGIYACDTLQKKSELTAI